MHIEHFVASFLRVVQQQHSEMNMRVHMLLALEE